MTQFLYKVRTDFSLGESLLSPKKAVQIAKKANIQTVALVDTMTISSMTDFVKECNAQEIKPIIGCRLRAVSDIDYRKPTKTSMELPKKVAEWYPNVFVKNEAGMVELMKLLSLANSEERFYFNARLSLEDITSVIKNGNLLLSTGDLGSAFILKDKDYNYHSVIDQLGSVISREDLFIELFHANTVLHQALNKKALKLARDWNLSILPTNLLLYDQPKDADTLDVLSVITSNGKMSNPWRNIQQAKTFHDKLSVKIIEDFKHITSDVYTISDFIDECAYKWKPMPVSLPVLVADERAEIFKQVAIGWKERIKNPIMGYQPPDSLMSQYKERLAYEISVISKMKFERYFLVVQDLVKWSKKNGIIVGPGRGSVSGSLVSFLMGITDVDPIRFNLLFERFINPDRLDLPDADLDFMSTRRHEVIDYLIDKYGQDKVAGVSNYATLASASALRDCGRVFGLTPDQMTATRYVPKENGTPYSLTEAAAVVPELQAFKDKHADIWNYALGLEGRMRSLGKHAAGVVIANEPITNRAVVETRSGASVANWDRNSIESWGLIKLDILGLSTLDMLSITSQYIKENTGNDIDLLSIPLEDRDTMRLLAQGQTVGIFQLESGGMVHLLKELAKGGTLTFDDICATTALYRPGPMESGMLDQYVKVKQGLLEPEYDHPKMKDSLAVTGGVFIYQENIMQISKDIAGYSMAEADKLRKIMGKKQPEEMAKQEERFVAGAMAGYVDVEMDDGSFKNAHAMTTVIRTDTGERVSLQYALDNHLDVLF